MNRLIANRFCHGLALVAVQATWFASTADADVRLPALFADHMVVQRETPIPVWGWANPGEQLSVTLSSSTAQTTADQRGRWLVRLPALPAGGPHELRVAGANQLAVRDVLVGEVWLASGQSNMAMTVNRAANFDEERSQANHPQIRMFKVAANNAAEPQSDCTGQWSVCSPDTVAGFSATGYFFARDIHQALGVPVGVINSSVGGTPIEAWISAEAQRSEPALAPLLALMQRQDAEFNEAEALAAYQRQLTRWEQQAAAAKAAGNEPPRRPRNPVELHQRKSGLGGLYNGMIAPLVPYAIRGAIWYQGEANSLPEKAPYYQHHLPLLVRSWRGAWGQGDFPVAWVQLPNYAGAGRDWPTVREAMLKSLATPNTGMAIALDVGETNDIHPRDKQTVGRRLGQWAQGAVYQRNVATSGPTPKSYDVAGSAIRVRFDHAYEGLVKKGAQLGEFEVAGADRVWHSATARIEHDAVVASSDQVSQPVAVRYAWSNDPTASLFNARGLPATPFRSVDW